MAKPGELKSGPGGLVNRTHIARAIYNAAASMGISDREEIDKITAQVIGRLERPAVLPGMEDFMPKGIKQPLPQASESDILAMVKEFLSVEKPEVAEAISIRKKKSLPPRIKTCCEPAEIK
jgi:ribonucleoside-diphosphate reductase alpha chain